HHRAMAARPSEQAPFSLQNFLQNLQDTIHFRAFAETAVEVSLVGERTLLAVCSVSLLFPSRVAG
ncbi:hypothetical protein NKJ50_06180, partial [Mesorhizobium sp. M0115]|uniref:hypothetical protein n=1 Tax=unclassified Mesorhizobium TaxID=325217 RepID=UPI003337EBF2